VRRLLALASALALLATTAGADVFVLVNGDRITGKRLRSATKRTVVVQTDYGRLTIPRSQVQKILKADGTEEYVAEGAPLPGAKLSLIVIGQSFWQAWEPKSHPQVDPSLRLEVRVDGEVVATYTDSRPDPKDLPGATVSAPIGASVAAQASMPYFRHERRIVVGREEHSDIGILRSRESPPSERRATGRVSRGCGPRPPRSA